VIARPVVTAVYGGAEEGIAAYVAKLKTELCDIMAMCGAKNIGEISSDMLYTK
jgi:isopentenyl diphosphate isomerase/L-lactate dehydrogenase-like FMN-dependent dehydrogenase